jgi:hypothetical protein
MLPLYWPEALFFEKTCISGLFSVTQPLRQITDVIFCRKGWVLFRFRFAHIIEGPLSFKQIVVGFDKSSLSSQVFCRVCVHAGAKI